MFIERYNEVEKMTTHESSQEAPTWRGRVLSHDMAKGMTN
jgi:hypothetical protein